MSKSEFYKNLQAEVNRIDKAKVAKRFEKVINSFTSDPNPRAVIAKKAYTVFNSNDYLGLRHHPELKKAEHDATTRLGTGPGAVRFISGSFQTHLILEQALADFHKKEAAILFSSAFAANLATIFSLVRKQSRDSLLNENTLILSDELNHRSIIDGIRITNLDKAARMVFKHLDIANMADIIKQNIGEFDRVVILTDGVFSMLGEYQDLAAVNEVIGRYDAKYPQGILLIVDDCHGVAAFGKTGRGCEEVCQSPADVIVGTLGKGFGVDGGYVAASQAVIDYLRESAATYIYSNSISPGAAAAAHQSIKIIDSPEGTLLLQKLENNIQLLKKLLRSKGFEMAADSIHPIQPLLIGDALKTKALITEMFKRGYLLSSINFPVVPKGRDEIRIQLSAAHTSDDIQNFVNSLELSYDHLGFR
jgi:glycine C-acetyltransferase